MLRVHGRCQALPSVVLSLYCATPGFLLSRLRGLARLEASGFRPGNYTLQKRRTYTIGKDISFLKSFSLRISLTEHSVANISSQTPPSGEEHGSESHFMRLHNLLNPSHPRTIES